MVHIIYRKRKWTYYAKADNGFRNWNVNLVMLNYNTLNEVLEQIAINDNEFSEKYNFSEFPERTDNQKSAEVTLYNFMTRTILSTINVKEIKGLNPDILLYGTINNDLFIGDSIYLNANDSYTINYYSEEVDKENKSIEFAQKFDKLLYEEMLAEAMLIYDEDVDDYQIKVRDTLRIYTNELQKAYTYYDDTYQEPSMKIKDLAEEITKDLNFDYDKAKAIEEYFTNEGFVYDLDYQPEEGNEGAEYFIFNSKKGSCSSYATAMTLMSRAIGLPSRYIEGFLMTEKEDDTTFLVRGNDAHAFTEVFISGYGWMTFDATVSTSNQSDEKASIDKISTENLKRILIIVVSSTLIILLLIILFLPLLKELAFRVHIKLLKNDLAILLLYNHIIKRTGKKLDIDTKAFTAKMIERKILEVYGIIISEITIPFEKVCYGEKILLDEELLNAYKSYLNFYKITKRKKK